MSIKGDITPGALLPHDIHAEAATLGSVLLDRDAILPIAALLTPEMFYVQKYGMIWAAQLACTDQRIAPDLINVSAELKRRKQLDLVGGYPALIDLSNSVPTALNVEYYAAAVHEAWLHRQVIAAAGQIATLGADTTLTPAELLGQTTDIVLRLAEGGAIGGFVSMDVLADETAALLEAAMASDMPLTGLATGFAELDRHTGGLQKSDLLILAARPAVGKTSLTLNIAVNAAKSGASVAIFSLEMSRQQLMQRMLATETGVDMQRIRAGRLDGPELRTLMDGLGVFSGLGIHVDDTAGATLAHIRAKSRQLQAERGLDLIVIDYLQLMSTGRKDGNRVLEISEISRGLKILARDLNVPVIALSQLSRAVESRPNKVPVLSDLRESGSLEQDADIVMFIYREELYDPETDKKGIAELHLAKHRNGPTGIIPLRFFKSTTKFATLDTFHVPEGYGPPATAPRGFGYDTE